MVDRNVYKPTDQQSTVCIWCLQTLKPTVCMCNVYKQTHRPTIYSVYINFYNLTDQQSTGRIWMSPNPQIYTLQGYRNVYNPTDQQYYVIVNMDFDVDNLSWRSHKVPPGGGVGRVAVDSRMTQFSWTRCKTNLLCIFVQYILMRCMYKMQNKSLILNCRINFQI